MTTPYSDIYEIFKENITDYELLSLSEDDLNTTLKNFLKGAIVYFSNCKKDLSDRDDTNEEFNIDLNDTEIEILAQYMVLKWLEPRIKNIANLEQFVNSSDFKLYSQANHLGELRQLYKDAQENIFRLESSYSWQDGVSDIND